MESRCERCKHVYYGRRHVKAICDKILVWQNIAREWESLETQDVFLLNWFGIVDPSTTTRSHAITRKVFSNLFFIISRIYDNAYSFDNFTRRMYHSIGMNIRVDHSRSKLTDMTRYLIAISEREYKESSAYQYLHSLLRRYHDNEYYKLTPKQALEFIEYLRSKAFLQLQAELHNLDGTIPISRCLV